MENVEKIIELLHKKRTTREAQFAVEEKKQIAEYNDLMNKLQTLRDERDNSVDNITKNIQRLTTHKRSIYELMRNSETIPGLPVSHNYQRQAISFFSEGVDFINKLPNIYGSFDSNNKENKINPIDVLRNVTSRTDSIGSELFKTKSLITEIKTLQENINILQKYCSDNSDEDKEV